LGWNNFLVCQTGAPFSGESGLTNDKVFPFRMRGELDFVTGIRIGRLAAKIGASIIHCHTALAHTLGIIACFVCKAKLVVTRRVDFPLRSAGFSLWKYRRADNILAISNRIRDILIQSGIPEDKVTLVPDGVIFKDNPSQTNILQLQNELGISQNDKVIGTVAALVGHKDYPTLFRAFNVVLSHHPDCWLLALGEGDDRSQLESLAVKLDIARRVKFLGFKENVDDFFNIFDVYVQSSRLEGLCSSLIEAMYRRLPIAAASAGGIPDLIEDEVTGLLSAPEDYEGLAKSILRLLEDRDLGEKLGAAAMRKSYHFSAENMVNRTEAVYKIFDF